MTLGDIDRKRFVIRLSLVVFLVALGFGLYYIGKEHEILLDNKTADIGGKTYEAAKYMIVTVDGKEDRSIELYEDDRDIVKVSGPNHKIKVDIVDEETEQVIKTAERSFNFKTAPRLMISMPALAEGATDVCLPLPESSAAATDETAQNSGGEGSPAAGTTGTPQ